MKRLETLPWRIGGFVYKARKLLGVSQTWAARQMGTTQPVVSRWEGGGPVGPKYWKQALGFLKQAGYDEDDLLAEEELANG